MNLKKKANKLIVIGGPTASGKTSLAIELAQFFNTEILSADSRQCYRELNIGVAKPSVGELSQVPHHFINSHSIHEEVTAGTFMRYGLKVLKAVFEHRNIAICVGGTGLYINALCNGLDEIPPVDKDIKKEVEASYEQHGLEWLRHQLQKVDQASYKTIDAQNPMRLLRALIFFKSHQQSIQDFKGKLADQRPFDISYYAIQMNRELLYQRINGRVDKMMEQGLQDEVKSLKEFKSCKALQTVGYKELFSYFDNEMSQKEAIEKIKQHTRNYAKRQNTWFKNQGDFMLGTAVEIMKEVKSTNCR